MRKWALLLVLPWVVELTTSEINHAGNFDPPYARYQDRYGAIKCVSKEACEDLVEALNEAHERNSAKRDEWHMGNPGVSYGKDPWATRK